MADSSSTKLVFPLEELTVLGSTGTITFDEALQFDKELLQNARSVTSQYGNGNVGHIHQVVTPAEYAARSPIVYEAVAFPQLIIAPGATGPQIAQANREYSAALSAFNKNNLVATALISQVTKAIPSIYLQALEDPVTGMEEVTIFQLRQHIKIEYGTATAQQIEANYAMAGEPFNLSESVEAYTGKMERVRRLAAATNDPMSDTASIRFAVAAMAAMGQFKADLHARTIEQQLPGQADETWPAFVSWLKRVDKARRQEKTVADAGYMAQANFASAVAAAVREQIAATHRAPANPPPPPPNNNNNQGNNGNNNNNNGNNAPHVKKYCHSHGYCGHTSMQCNRRSPGHQEAATSANKMGGNETNFVYRNQRSRAQGE
ncbi:hypothetical protein MPSEU_000042900 [Mayamaea pseudoterrestris]|nr:hypothetical protein MPSEU_000042900 [Mayamaea pseudoterrestris]